MRLWKRCVLFCVGGNGLSGAGAAVAGLDAWQHVCGGRPVFFADRPPDGDGPPKSLPVQTLLGAGVITMVELAAGLMVNQSYQVWDYRGLPLNFWGRFACHFACCGFR